MISALRVVSLYGGGGPLLLPLGPHILRCHVEARLCTVQCCRECEMGNPCSCSSVYGLSYPCPVWNQELSHALARGAPRLYAELRGYGMSGDAFHITQPSPEGTGAALAMERALRKVQARHSVFQVTVCVRILYHG